MAVSIPVLTCYLLLTWLLCRAFVFWFSETSTPTTSGKLIEPPAFRSRIPFIGHILGIISKGSNLYISALCASQCTSISTLRLPGQDMHFIHPLDAPSVKQFTSMRFLSLMTVFRVAIGSCMGLVPASEKLLSDPDTGAFKKHLSKLFNEELRALQNLKKNAAQLELKAGEYWDKTIRNGDPVEVDLGNWLFDMLSYTMGAVFWGEEGPFEDAYFRGQLMVLIQNLEAFQNPITFLIPKKYFAAREFVRETLDKAAKRETYGSDAEEPTLFKRLTFIYESLDCPKEGYTDCHLVAIVGLMSNVINIITWAICHIVADPELTAGLLSELDAVVDHTQSVKSLDIDRVRSSCPLLVSTWYELLRVYGDSPVARYVYEDSVFDARYQIKKGAIIMTPIHLHNFALDTWGEDVEVFRPSRFLKDNGEVDYDLIKHLNVFGLPGMHQCPGRYLGLNITLSLVAKALLSFEMVPANGDVVRKGVVPGRKDTMLGLPAIARDPKVIVRRRPGVDAVRVSFDNVRPGW
ncbi:cytochrome P450 [Cercophora scortea]|uniref:Cytochrome P450 n=1 Tax=Cercophora scortea TaxID=314031 RepID=A0AAE0MN56_9PEZI|nr:cytochrome P450 [Cercophora scortea]